MYFFFGPICALGIRTQDVIIYDDVDTSEKEPK